jgi:hypothetical protein
MGGTSKVVYKSTDTTEIIEIRKIDDEVKLHVNDYVSIIQLDVEGYEEKALKGAVATLREFKPILILEMWSKEAYNTEFFNDVIFGELGYTFHRNVHENIVLIAQ